MTALLQGEVKLPPRTRLVQVDDPETGEEVLMLYRWNGEYHSALSDVISAVRAEGQSGTYQVYARSFLRFDAYADKHFGILWDSEPEKILQAYDGYLTSLGAVITINPRTGTRQVTASEDTVPINGQLPQKAATLKAVHEAMRAVYKKARELELYPYPHPLDKVNAEKLRAQAKKRDIAQAEQSLRRPGQPYRRDGDPGRLYMLVDTDWVPKHIYWDDDLREPLRSAFEMTGATLRDWCVMELMLTGGVRLAEACATSLAGWVKGTAKTSSRLGQPGTARLGNEIWMRNKGDGEAEVKLTPYPPETMALIRRYWAEERHKHDPRTPAYLEWLAARQPDVEHTPELYVQFLTKKQLSLREPLFLSRHDNGNALTTSAFRQAGWAKAIAHAGLILRPHQLRHWYICHQLYWIARKYKFGPDKNERTYAQARLALGKRMGWKHPVDMLEIYDQISMPQPALLMSEAAKAANARLDRVAVGSPAELYGAARPPAVDSHSKEAVSRPDNGFGAVIEQFGRARET